MRTLELARRRYKKGFLPGKRFNKVAEREKTMRGGAIIIVLTEKLGGLSNTSRERTAVL